MKANINKVSTLSCTLAHVASLLPLCCLFVAMLSNALHVCVAGYPTTKEKVRVRQSTGRTEGMSRKCIVRSPSVCVCIDPLPSPVQLVYVY